MTKTSHARIERFIDTFIRTLESFGSSSDDWINDPERMSRCDAAAENGCDGSTHRETIDDWRATFNRFVRDRKSQGEINRFSDAVHDHFDQLEQWHIANGSIDQQIG